MKFLLKKLALCTFIMSLGWISASLAQDASGQQSQAPSAVAPPPASALNKDAVCTGCHDENSAKPILAIYQTKHGVRGDSRTPSCQSCHGDSEKHLKGDPAQQGRAAPDVLFGNKKGSSGSFSPSEAKVQNSACLSCHDKDSKRTHWQGGQHDVADVACASCHEVHAAHDKVRDKKTQTEVCFTCHKEQRAESHKISTHPIDAGKVVCSDCHNPHGSAGPKMLKKNTVTETCYTCHAEKRGPFVFAHQPVTEDCTNCHTPHGSNTAPLLKSRPPFMCQECHDGSHASGTPVAGNASGFQGGLSRTNAAGAAQFPSKNNVGNACMNCHRQIHGSNSPAGGYLQR